MGRDSLICAKCGARMNHHADKVDCGPASGEARDCDPAFEGVVLLVYCCPDCGETAAVKE